MYYSQLGQDKFIDDYFNNANDLVFVDIGAHDGVTLSNTYFLEKERNWKGLCVEAQPTEFKKLITNRKCICANYAIANFDGHIDFTCVEGYANMLSGISHSYNTDHRDRILREINSHGGSINNINLCAKKLQSLLDEYNIRDIDFCSIDTEGSELDIVKSIDFEKTQVKVFIIENNYQESNVYNFLQTKGYELNCKLQWDDVFIKKNI